MRSKDKNPLEASLQLLRDAASATKRTLEPVSKSPDEALGELFRLVQLSRIHPDGKTFVDQVPNVQLRHIVRQYKKLSGKPDFDLNTFIDTYFGDLVSAVDTNKHHTTRDDPETHITTLWDELLRSATKSSGSLLTLPQPYIVPGGRFSEQYYWDSYFTMLGLEASERYDISDGMMQNFQHMFAKFGFIPTANRTYYLSRSQPPFFLHMVRLIAHRKGHYRYLLPRLHFLVMEYTFWMKDSFEFLQLGKKRYKRLVKMPNGVALSRYYDGQDTPRPESYREDIETAEHTDRKSQAVYRDLRAAAESGWDFSSRWLANPKKLETIQTTQIVPLDLNCLLFELELALAEAYRKLFQLPLAKYYENKANKRRETINAYLWDDELGYYFDWHAPSGTRTDAWTLAGAFPLYCGVATTEQAGRVAEVLKEQFLKPGGVVTTLRNTPQQWDWPNGWAPLQWTTIVGLRRYGFDELADTIKQRWLATGEALFANEHKFVEKYNVVDPTARGGGGEYTLQDGFGWTNGVFIALRRNLDVQLAAKIKVMSKEE